MRGIKSGAQADVCAVVEPTEWQKRKMTREERLYSALLEPAKAKRFADREGGKWFCVSVKSGTEFALERKLSTAGVEAFVLRDKEEIVKKGVKYFAETPVFRGYLFVRILPSPEAFHALKEVEEVRDFLGNGTRYTEIPDAHMVVFTTVSKPVDVQRMPVDRSIGQGQRVRIIDGHFAGGTCIVLQVKSGRNPRVRVYLEGYGEFARDVTLDLALLQKL